MVDVPLHDLDGYIWFDGELVPCKEAKIHVLTHSLHYGSAAFEGARCYNGKIFKNSEHNKRLLMSAKELGFEVPYTYEEVDNACNETITANSLTNAYIRAISWRGSEALGVTDHGNVIHTAVATWEWGSYFDPSERMKGIKIMMSDWVRPGPNMAPVHAKASGLYQICTLSKKKAEESGYADALMLDYRGHVAECSGANIFFVFNGELHTPIADCFLNGITRQTVIAIAKDAGIKVVERTILPEELSNATECFVTGTAAEITPVSEIGEHKYTPSEMTSKLIKLYDAETGKTE
ncbi:MAG: branched-chain amino acid aminotransferase [Alphaproteobacteria bacterium]|nr:branched-chain amino acid aminotransferase [Alphaproteobacteria bacterium]